MAVSNRRQKKKYTGMIGIVLVSLLAISITYAYLQSHTEEVTNTFTLGEGVKVELEHESGLHEDFTPGMEYDQPATVIVPSTAMDQEYIAVKVEFFAEVQGDDGNLTLTKINNADFLDSYAHFQSYALSGGVADTTNASKQTGARTGWTEDENNPEIFYYGELGDGNMQLTQVSSGTSITFFDQIKVNDPYKHVYSMSDNATIQEVDLTVADEYKYIVSDETRELKKGQLVTFHTVVSAYAVQGDISSEQAMGEFEYLFNNTTSG